MYERIEIMDTTLRDGEQTDGVSFSTFDKRQIARFLLESLQVDRIEIASARVSPGEHKTAKEIFQWANEKNLGDRIEILGFVDDGKSIEWISEAGGGAINLLTKGSLKHCKEQLGKKPAEHLSDIERTVRMAHDAKFRINVYLEDWSNGYLNSPDYVFEMLDAFKGMPIHRILLPDTLGILSPEEVYAGFSEAKSKYPDLEFDFHGHNDYDLATANCLAAVRGGAKGIHTAVNGLGERAGNSPLESVVTALHDKLGVKTSVNEKAIMDASRLVETFSGKRVSPNHPVVGQDVYTQTAGIHADGDKKNNLYANPILPERFGRHRVYALGKLSGKASISNNLKSLGLELTPERELELLARVKELGEQKKSVTIDDLPFLIEDLFGSGESSNNIRITGADILSSTGNEPRAKIQISYFGTIYEQLSTGNGGYDAFMKALHEIARRIGIEIPALYDYEVRIPPGGKTDALVEVVITWENPEGGRHFKTVGVDPDQVVGAIKATEKMLNRVFAGDSVQEIAKSKSTQPSS